MAGRTIIIRNAALRSTAVHAVSHIKDEPLMEVVIREHKSQRSIAQNSLLHAWMKEVSVQRAESHGEFHAPEMWKEYFKRLHLGEETIEVAGRSKTITKKSRNLKVKEMTELLEFIDHFCGSEMNIFLPHPEDREQE